MWSKIRKFLTVLADVMIYGRDKGWWKREKIENFDEYLSAFKTGAEWRKLQQSLERDRRLNKVGGLMREFENQLSDDLNKLL